MKYLIRLLLFILCIALLFVLYRYGISSFLTTALVYYFIYFGLNALLGLVSAADKRELLRGNLRSLMLLLLFLEFTLTFILGVMNTPMEKERFLYLSEYKRAAQSTLLLSLGIEEARFVFTDRYIPGSQRTLSKKDYTYTHHYNAGGLRGPLPALAKDSNEYRIVLLGDSFAEGEGAPDDSTIAVRLQDYLRQRHPGKPISVINGGISGSSPVYEQKLYLRHLQAYKPDLVIQTWYANDLFDINVMLHSEKLPAIEYPWAISHIYRVIYILFINPDYVLYGYSEKPAKENREFLLGYIREKTDSFRNELRTGGTELLTVYIPSKDEYDTYDIRLTAQQRDCVLGQYADLNLFPVLPQAMDSSAKKTGVVQQLFWVNDAHFRPSGFDLTARILAGKVRIP